MSRGKCSPQSHSGRSEIERSASTPLEGRGVLARWDAEDDSLRVYSSTQTTTVRPAASKTAVP